MTQELCIDDVLRIIRPWPSSMRAELARRLTQEIEQSMAPDPRPRGLPADKLLGLWNPNGDFCPNDQEVKQIIEDELVRKYLS